MTIVIPAKAGIQIIFAIPGLFAALTLRATLRVFNALRAFVRLALPTFAWPE